MSNPFDHVGNLVVIVKERLQEVPLAVRQKIYAYGALAVAVYGVWEASNHDWPTFWKSLGIAVVGIMARANATPDETTDPDTEEFVDEETFDLDDEV